MHAAATINDGAAFLPWLVGVKPRQWRDDSPERSGRISLAERVERFLDGLLRPAPTMKLTLRGYPY